MAHLKNLKFYPLDLDLLNLSQFYNGSTTISETGETQRVYVGPIGCM